MTEDQFQASIFLWAWNTFPESRRCLWAVPNGGWMKNKIEAMKLKATGVVAGVWDLHLFFKGRFYIFELKVGTNTLQDNQIDWGVLMKQHGATLYVISEAKGGLELFKQVFTQIMTETV